VYVVLHIDGLADSEKIFRNGKLSGTQFDASNTLDVDICYAMRMSNTQRGAPFELSQDAFIRLLQHLHAMTSLLKVV
jgi:hypothetical protein